MSAKLYGFLPPCPKIPPDNIEPPRSGTIPPEKSDFSRSALTSGVRRAIASSLLLWFSAALAKASSGVMPKFSKEKGLPRSGPTLALRCPSSVLENQLLYAPPMLIAGVGVVSSSP